MTNFESYQKRIETLNGIFATADNTNMTALMNTAGCWHGGQTSALYSLLSTEIVHNECHRDDCIIEIDRCLNDMSATLDEFTKTERKELQELKKFVEGFVFRPTENEIDEMMQCEHDDAYGIVDAYFPED